MVLRTDKNHTILVEVFFLLLCGAIPALVSQLNPGKPTGRYIHIESFRYGKDPSTIHCNRGDTLHLTFSSRDAGHSFFLQDFDMDVKVSPSTGQVLQYHASDPQLPPVTEDTVVFVAEHSGFTRFLVSKSIFRCHVYCGPLHAFEQGNLVIGPNTLLNAGWGVLFGLLVVGVFRVKLSFNSGIPPFSFRENDEGKDIFKKFPRLKNLIKKSWFQPALMLLGGVILYVVLLTSIFGTKVSGRNLGVMLVWVVWLFLLVSLLTPLGGRLWCTMCPLPTVGEFLQRRSIATVRIGSTNGYRNQFFGLNLDWPKWLTNGWPRLIAFLIAGTLSTTFVAQPRSTGFAILAFVATSTAMSLVFKLRSFCQFICPINTFVGTYSQVGNLALRKSDPEVCNNCKGDFCEKGSHTGWPCPYDLNVRDIDTNFDCGLCTECIRSCVYDNVTIKWRQFGSEAAMKDTSLGWTAMAMFVLGVAYTIVYLGHWSRLRDYINVVEEGHWRLFAIYTVAIWSSALLVFPSLMYAVTSLSRRLSGAFERTFGLMIASSGALLPLGLFVWIAFSLQMLFVNFTFVEQSLNDPFGWGWNIFGLAGTPWVQIAPQWVPWLQVILVLTGFGYSFRNLFRIWIDKTHDRRLALRGLLPMASFLSILTAALIQFYAN
ncbi:MAG: 4Fe-4S binding protein [Bacteroidota bacterium]